ncbi:hypothetical protein [Mycetocola sp. 2940]|uniref:hypothetical protein n=1 Tax=Mycetocola sp. 2940 TaxID=3156452 RepID=UPI003390D1C0
MRTPRPLPPELGSVFSFAEAQALGVGRRRLAGTDLESPFRGVRAIPASTSTRSRDRAAPEDRVQEERTRAMAYATRMRAVEFFSHQTAAALWGAPVTLPVGALLDVSVFGNAGLPRGRGVRGHRADRRTTTTTDLAGLRVASAASVWASLGSLPVESLVMIGDYFCRVWREGFLRPDVGREPLATRAKLAAALGAGRRVGATRLRTALELIREDAWSPMESLCRLILVTAGLPEPVLNTDVYGRDGGFLACVDLAYPRYRIAIEYQGQLHGSLYAKDVERLEALRREGWIVIQVSSALIGRRAVLVARVREALESRGWRS